MKPDTGSIAHSARSSNQVSDPSQSARLFLPEMANGPLCQELPKTMIVAIDGRPHSRKRVVGELVAEAIAAALVDSEHFYRALAQACLHAGGHLHYETSIARFCHNVSLEVCLGRDEGKVDEAVVLVNGQRFGNGWFKPSKAELSRVAAVPEARDAVHKALRTCDQFGRVVVVGCDIGGVVFPGTAYKFVLDESKLSSDPCHETGNASEGNDDGQHQVVFARDALMIDTAGLVPAAVRRILVVEILRRAELQARPAAPNGP